MGMEPTSETTGARVGLVGRRLADQFKIDRGGSGMAFSGRCGPPQPFLVDLKRLRGCSLWAVSLFCPGGLVSSQAITIPMQMCKIVVQRAISWRFLENTLKVSETHTASAAPQKSTLAGVGVGYCSQPPPRA